MTAVNRSMLDYLTVFTPSVVEPDVLASFTVGRSHELATLTRSIDEAIASSARPHVLLVGSRGAGKSHLLALAAHHVRTEHGQDVALAWMPEDVYSITSYRDLLAELHSLATGEPADPAASAGDLEVCAITSAGKLDPRICGNDVPVNPGDEAAGTGSSTP